MRVLTGAVVVAAAAAAMLQAQEPSSTTFVRSLDMKVQAERMAVESRITRGAPYSADAVTESVQVLADGNRIVTKNAARIVRDSEGRTRREQLRPNGTDVASINISDPVAEAMYFLDPATHTAYHNGVIIATGTGIATASITPGARGTIITRTGPDGGVIVSATETSAKGSVETEVGETVSGSAASGGAATGFSYSTGRGRVGGPSLARVGPGEAPANTEDLGSQVVEGVLANGKRTTTEIAAGAIGNEHPIRIVSEQWFSPELQILLLTKHSDPRVGETTYRLTNIVRAEPARSLFEIPSDYTLKESTIRKREQ
jgi:hypothetical protein